MTTNQLVLFTVLYTIALVVVAFLTRATARRIAGALAGGAAMGVAVLVVVPLGEALGWWHFVMSWTPSFLVLFYLGCVVSSAFVCLLTWRIARRFGGRGLAVVVLLLMLFGPVRDYTYMALFPEWGAYAPGIAPVLAISVTYATVIILGQSAMRLVAGPSRGSPLARRRWEPAAPSAA